MVRPFGQQRHLNDVQPILVINAGSSSLKLGLFAEREGGVRPLWDGSVDGIDASHLSDGLKHALDDAERATGLRPGIVGHRVVHGGPHLVDHQRITPEVKTALRACEQFRTAARASRVEAHRRGRKSSCRTRRRSRAWTPSFTARCPRSHIDCRCPIAGRRAALRISRPVVRVDRRAAVARAFAARHRASRLGRLAVRRARRSFGRHDDEPHADGRHSHGDAHGRSRSGRARVSPTPRPGRRRPRARARSRRRPAGSRERERHAQARGAR